MEEKKGFFKRLVEGLTKTRDNVVSKIDEIFSGFSSIDDDFYDEIEEILVMGDIGINATTSIIEDLKQKVKDQNIKDPAACKQLLIDSIKQEMNVGETAYEFETRKSVVLVIGVNGVGKTTSVGKLAGKLKDQGKKVVLAAADTFRAAAGEQLTEWAKRADVDIIGGQEGSDPASVVYDAIAASRARDADVLLIDTAGRLHNKKNLMNELEQDQPDSRPGISGGVSGDFSRTGRNDRTECAGAGKGVQGGGGHNRYYPDEAGRNGKGWNRSGDPLGAWHSREIHRSR